jgi:4-hydroxybenzoate polyprenyltransferase
MLFALLKTMRPKQWTKNIAIFAALVFDKKLTDLGAALPTLAGFILFCLLSSTVYIFNDLADVESDRQHPKKKHRPIASGDLPIPVARIAAILFFIIGLSLSYLLDPLFGIAATAYLLGNLAYSFRLKHIPLLDVLILASFYVLRVAAGVILVVVERFSPWLYVVTIFAALFIGIGKRRAEMQLEVSGERHHRPVLKSYTMALLDQMTVIVSTITIITYSLYTFFAPNLPENHSMMLTIPFVIYGIFRYLYLLQVEGTGGAPEDIVFQDRPIQLTLLLWGTTVLFIFYAF